MSDMLSAAVSALDSYGTGMQVIAHNVANINTDEFQASRIHYGDMPNGGVRVEDIRQDTAAGDMGAGRTLEAESAEEARTASNVQIERELTEAMTTEQAYTANAAVARTYEDMLGTVIDMVV
ncbi:MAG: hypothetical protein LBD82_00195 [Deltaproteobacteria bacterium]|jgi:flagellar basal-body rod protein FlgC|nr:hypothetical protein [Deltaproteobacteria bacterium]